MFDTSRSFSGFSVDDTDRALAFYRDVLGLTVEESGGGMLTIALDSGATVLVYPKGARHVPAEFTVLNFGVPDVEAAVDRLNAAGVVTKIYPGMGDAKGIQRGGGPDIAWFTDPAGNVLSVLSDRPAAEDATRGAAGVA